VTEAFQNSFTKPLATLLTAAAMQLEQQFSQAITASSQLLTSSNGARFKNPDGSQVVEFVR